MPKKVPPSEEDLKAFQEAVQGTIPLSQNKIRLAQHQDPSPPQVKKTNVPTFELKDPPFHEAVIKGEEIITYKHQSISHKILRKLRKGQYNVEAVLDLHGMTVEEAKEVVKQFLQQCLQEEMRVVLIIHGKGHHSHTPILKTKLNYWLRSLEVVLAFCSAAQQHGSRGATYVLLKRLTEEERD